MRNFIELITVFINEDNPNPKFNELMDKEFLVEKMSLSECVGVIAATSTGIVIRCLIEPRVSFWWTLSALAFTIWYFM